MQITNRRLIAGLAAVAACTSLAITAQSAQASKRSTSLGKPGSVNMHCRHAPASVDQPGTSSSQVQLGSPAPNFKATRLDCGTTTLKSITGNGPQGHITFINFFASWCGPCNQEAPDLAAFYNKHHGQGLNGIGIDTGDDGPPPGDPSKFYTNYHLPFLSVWDTPQTTNPLYDNPVYTQYKHRDMLWVAYETQPAVGCIPTTFWLHKDGTVAVINVGLMTPADMEQDYKWAQMSQSALENDPSYVAYEATHAKCIPA